MTKRLIAIAVSFALVGSLFVGCGQKAAAPAEEPKKEAAAAETKKEEKKEEKKVAGKLLWSSHRTDFQTTVLPEYIKEFNQQFPDVKIEIETYKDYYDTMKVKMSSNDMPDIWTTAGDKFTREQRQAASVDVSDIAKDYQGTDLFQGADNKVYGIPTGMSATAVVYNKKLFKELGIEVPKTLDEFIAAGKKIKAAGKVGLATAAKAKWPLSNYWFATPDTIAGEIDIKNKYANEDEPFNPDNALVKSYMLLKKFKDEGILEKDPVSADWEPMKKEFRAGNVGMFYLGNWFIPQAIGEALKTEDVGFFPLPYDNDPNTNCVAMGPDVGWAMGKNSKAPEAQKAFYTWLVDTKHVDWANKTGLLPAKNGAKADAAWVTEFNSFNPKPLTGKGDTKELNDIVNKVQFDNMAFAQDILAGKDLNKMFADLNAKWKKARGK
ncbi:MAG: ABC transporter substrate-binding protein [Clostridia bacterium]|nr:ABC transporter substrate-binding protein [Clostridia bacterium]